MHMSDIRRAPVKDVFEVRTHPVRRYAQTAYKAERRYRREDVHCVRNRKRHKGNQH